MRKKSFVLILLLCLFSILAADTIKIGVLAKQGKQECLERWTPFTNYLSEEFPEHSFKLLPMGFHEVEDLAKNSKVDFIFTNPYLFAKLEFYDFVSPLATLQTKHKNQGYDLYAGVLFCRADNAEINTLEDVKGKSLSAVAENSFGGKIMALRLLQKNGISHKDDLGEIFHAGTHGAVVHEVLEGKAAFGTVRSSILEEMAETGEIDLNEIKVINPIPPTLDFPYLRSTMLYPEWPFAKVKHTDPVIANQIAMLLFEIPYHSIIAQEIGIWGWTYPSSYGIIHHTMANLKLAPYPVKKSTLIQLIVKEYLKEAIVVLIFLILAIFFSLNLHKIHSREKMEAEILKRVEDKLKSSQANLHSLIESTDDAIVSFDKEGRLLICNAKFREIVKKSSGLDLEPGMKLLEITPPDQKEFWEDVYQRALNGKKFSKIMSYHQDSPNPRYYHITFNPIIKNGKITGFTEFSRDISNMKQKEIELRKMHEAVEQSASSIIITDKNGKIEYVNPRFSEIAGYTKEEVLGKTSSIIKSDYHSDDFYKNMWEAITSGKTWEGEIKNKKKNGKYYWKVSTIAPIKNDKGVITNFIAINEDITSRKEAEAELQKANQKLRELSGNLEEKVDKAVAEIQEKDHMLIAQSKQAAMGEMIANIAHQWRQPLSAVAAIVQDIEDAYEFDELTQQYLVNSVQKTMDQIQYMSRTIDDFRNFFNPNKSKVEFNIKTKIEKTLTFLKTSIKQYNIELIMNVEENCTCHGYPNEFSQVILNIINNAKDAIKENSPEEPYIKIECKGCREKIEIKISNNGGQIPEDKLNKIFQPYFTTKKEGTGLGLYMSKMIVERNLKGSISLQNIENGVEFKIEI